jgi:hypothetical protein
MALRDWLTRDLSGLADSPAGLATISKPLAKDANLQMTDSKEEKAAISRISRISISNAPELKKQGIEKLAVAAQGLPVTLAELEAFFANDLQAFGNGSVTMATIKQVVTWYVLKHLGRAKPEPEEIPAGMVRCTDCLQDRCKHRQVTPWGDVVMQSSPQWRWCSDYTARVHSLDDYRKR